MGGLPVEFSRHHCYYVPPVRTVDHNDDWERVVDAPDGSRKKFLLELHSTARPGSIIIIFTVSFSSYQAHHFVLARVYYYTCIHSSVRIVPSHKLLRGRYNLVASRRSVSVLVFTAHRVGNKATHTICNLETYLKELPLYRSYLYRCRLLDCESAIGLPSRNTSIWGECRAISEKGLEGKSPGISGISFSLRHFGSDWLQRLAFKL